MRARDIGSNRTVGISMGRRVVGGVDTARRLGHAIAKLARLVAAVDSARSVACDGVPLFAIGTVDRPVAKRVGHRV
jgi:hypothetical protein